MTDEQRAERVAAATAGLAAMLPEAKVVRRGRIANRQLAAWARLAPEERAAKVTRIQGARGYRPSKRSDDWLITALPEEIAKVSCLEAARRTALDMAARQPFADAIKRVIDRSRSRALRWSRGTHKGQGHRDRIDRTAVMTPDEIERMRTLDAAKASAATQEERDAIQRELRVLLHRLEARQYKRDKRSNKPRRADTARQRRHALLDTYLAGGKTLAELGREQDPPITGVRVGMLIRRAQKERDGSG